MTNRRNYKSTKMRGDQRDVFDNYWEEQNELTQEWMPIKEHYTEEELEAHIAKHEREIAKHEEWKNHFQAIKLKNQELVGGTKL